MGLIAAKTLVPKPEDKVSGAGDLELRIGSAAQALDSVLNSPSTRGARQRRKRPRRRWSGKRERIPDSKIAAAILSAVFDECLRSDDCLHIESTALTRAQIKERTGVDDDGQIDLALKYLIPQWLRVRVADEPLYFLPRADRLYVHNNRAELRAARIKLSA